MASTGAAPKPGANRVAPRRPKKEKPNRDPKNINEHIAIDFAMIIGEPKVKGLRSFDITWEMSGVCYTCFKSCIYKLFSLLCGICIAIYWGCQFAPVVFYHVWLLTPCWRLVDISCGMWLKTLVKLCVHCCITPCTQSCAIFFHLCGDGLKNRPETPSIFPKRQNKPKPKPIVQQEDKEPKPQSEKRSVLDWDYDKEKVVRSVKRQLLL